MSVIMLTEYTHLDVHAKISRSHANNIHKFIHIYIYIYMKYVYVCTYIYIYI
jgi:hypothetical protein